MTRTIKSGRYTLLRRLGEGAQGETWEARDEHAAGTRPHGDLRAQWKDFVRRANEPPSPHETVAVKCFRVGAARAWKDVELAEREARTLASLDHPALPKYVEHFEEDGVLYLVMQKIEGESLASIRARGGRMSADEVVRMLVEIGGALSYLHGRAPAVVHRDIKPGNVIRRPDGSFALVDFGAVRDRLKPAGGSTVVGTFGYMPPEQFQGRASTRSDLYGLGATAVAMLTGVEPEDLPHEGLRIDVARAIDGPRPLVRTLEAMLEPDPDRRAATIEDALARFQAPESKKTNRRQRRRERREEQRRLREARRGRRAPFLPRIVAQLAILLARAVVGVVVGAIVPLVLVILSLLFGAALRRAAAATSRAARRADARMARGSRWLAGHRAGDEDAPQVRVADDRRVRVGDEPGEEADEQGDLEDEPRRARR